MVQGYVCSSKTKQRIYDVASDLFLKNGYQATTLNDIAQAADVSTGTLYRYFPSKGDFLREIGKASVERLKEFAENIPEDTPASEAVLKIMLEDIRGTQHIFFSPYLMGENASKPHTNDIRMAYHADMYANEEHLDVELATRKELAGIYTRVIEQAKENGLLDVSFDSKVVAQIITAIFFYELDKGMHRFDYPYKKKFSGKLAVLFEGRECEPLEEAH